MHIDALKEKNSRFDDTMSAAIGNDGDDLQEASRLLYEIMDESTRYAYNALETEVNGNWKGITSLYYDCETMVKKILEGGGKTAFLSMAVLEDTFTKALPLFLVRAQDLLDGSSDMLNKIRKLQEIFRNDPCKAEWKNRSDTYKVLVERVGLSSDGLDYSDLTKILDPLLDALTFWQKHERVDPPRRFQFGPPGKPDAPPAFSLHVPIFHSEQELATSLLTCGKENAVMFAGLELTYADTENWFEEWYTGYENERMRNIMRNDQMTKEEYLAATDMYSRRIYLCVKYGGEIYLARMPYQRESYGGPDFSDKNKYCYGHRAGYAPYQAFYDEPPAAPEDTTFLALPRKGYLLSSIMDPEQRAWLPAFLNETFNHFFKNGPAKAVDAYLPSERALVSADGTELYRNKEPESAIVPKSTAMTAVRQQIPVPDPTDLFDEPFMKTLVRELRVTSDDLVAVGERILSAPALEDVNINARLRKAALRIVCERAQAYMAERTDATWQIAERIADNGAVVSRVLSGACKAFTTLTVAGVPDAKGVVGRITIDDVRPRGGLQVVWSGTKTSSNPPVLYEIRPKTAEDYAAILGLPVNALAKPLRLYTELQALWSKYQHGMPRPMSYHRMLEPPDLLRLNVCMSKTEYKRLLKIYDEEENHES